MWLYFLAFFVLNFAAIGLGGLFTSGGVISDWYLTLNKAPWTPPGWVFGVAWTTIMICFTFYMGFLWEKAENKLRLGVLFGIQWILNVVWNPIFFQWHQIGIGMIVISLLTLLIFFIFLHFRKILNWKSALILPYLIWLLIACSLNMYALLNN